MTEKEKLEFCKRLGIPYVKPAAEPMNQPLIEPAAPRRPVPFKKEPNARPV